MTTVSWPGLLRGTDLLDWALFSKSVYFMDFFFKCCILGQNSAFSMGCNYFPSWTSIKSLHCEMQITTLSKFQEIIFYAMTLTKISLPSCKNKSLFYWIKSTCQVPSPRLTNEINPNILHFKSLDLCEACQISMHAYSRCHLVTDLVNRNWCMSCTRSRKSTL